MQSRCSRQLSQATDGVLYLTRGNHHQICQLVDNDHDLWQLLRCRRIVSHTGSLDLLVVALQITHTVFGKFIIAVGHFRDCPVQRTGRFFRVGDDRNEQMWNTIVNAQFYDLRVDHDQLDILRLCLIENAHNQRIDADGFSGSGRSRDQKMRHLCDICHNGLSADIFSDGKRQIGLVLFKFVCLQQIPQHNGAVLTIRDFNTNRRFAGNRCFDPDVCCSQIQLDIIGERHDLLDLYALLRHQLIAGHTRPAAYICHFRMNAEAV